MSWPTCPAHARLANDPLFLVAGHGAWQLRLGMPRTEVRLALLNPVRFRETRPETWAVTGRLFHGRLLFQGNRLAAVEVELEYRSDSLEQPDRFYHSCQGFYEEDFLTLDRPAATKKLKEIYHHFPAFELGSWLIFAYHGIAWNFEKRFLPKPTGSLTGQGQALERVTKIRVFRPFPHHLKYNPFWFRRLD